MPYRNLKDLMVAIEDRLPNGAPKLSEGLPVVPDFLVELPDLPAPAKLPEMAAAPAGAGLKHYVTQVEIMPAAAEVASTQAALPLLRGLPDEPGSPDQQRLWGTREVIDKFLASKSSANLREASISSYHDTLMPFARAYPTLPDKPEPIEEYLAPFRGENSTAWNIYTVIRLLYNFAESRNLLPFPNPIAKVQTPKKVTRP